MRCCRISFIRLFSLYICIISCGCERACSSVIHKIGLQCSVCGLLLEFSAMYGSVTKQCTMDINDIWELHCLLKASKRKLLEGPSLTVNQPSPKTKQKINRTKATFT